MTAADRHMEWRRVGGRAVELYERHMVPGIFAPWAADLVTLAALRPGMQVLDVACGTGVVTREAARAVGPGGRALGLDLSPGMLAAAGRATPPELPIAWCRAGAAALPFGDGAFDAVLCQQGLQYIPDRRAALREMRRVLRPDGCVALSVFRLSPGHRAVAQALAPHLGESAAQLVLEPLALSSAEELAAILADAGLPPATIAPAVKIARLPSAGAFVGYQVASRLAAALARLDDAARAAVLDTACAALEPYVDSEGLAFPMESLVALARPG